MFAGIEETAIPTAMEIGITRIATISPRDALSREDSDLLSTVVTADCNIGHNTVEDTPVCRMGQLGVKRRLHYCFRVQTLQI